WSEVSTGTTEYLRGLFCRAKDDAWAVGTNGTIVHWDGMGWSTATSNTNHILNAVGGSAADDVWAVGEVGTLLHWDGMSWNASTAGSKTLWSVWAFAADDVWVGGDELFHFDGATWSPVTIASVPYPTIRGLWGAATNDLWATMPDGPHRLYHWDGATWTADTGGDALDTPTSIAGDATHLWIVGGAYSNALFVRIGSTWTETKPDPAIHLGSVAHAGTTTWVVGGDVDRTNVFRLAP
ncbi:MAG TPA: hypothetical protein VIF62_37700, partial [Labilithrix sp.]